MYGKVYIVGAGPGDPGLLTIKALEYLKNSQTVIYDRLIGKDILKYADKNAELIYVGKEPYGESKNQELINSLLVKKAKEGKTVIRLKGGDPFVYGRGAEEAEYLSENGIEFEIIPGITSAVAVPAYAGIPVTHRDFSSSLHIIAGHEKDNKDTVDYQLLAKIKGTLVFLMGINNIDKICSKLIDNGKESETPVAVIENGTTLKQKVLTGTLSDISTKVSENGIRSPAVIVIGNVVKLNDTLSWLKDRPLSGKKIVITRPYEQSVSFSDKIERLGAEAIVFPTIKIEETKDYDTLDKSLKELNKFDWLIFTSANAVRIFFNRMKELRIDIRQLFGIRLCSIGDVTAAELKARELYVDFVPDKYTTQNLLESLKDFVKPKEKILLVRNDIANHVLPDELKNNGIECTDLIVYKTNENKVSKDEITKFLAIDNIDYITFTSPSSIKSFISIIGKENINKYKKYKIVCIGPVTAKEAENSGFMVAGFADKYTVDGLIDKLIEFTEEDYGD